MIKDKWKDNRRDKNELVILNLKQNVLFKKMI